MKALSLFILALFTTNLSLSQSDSLVISDSIFLKCNILSMERGVLTVETDYSDSDFNIEWEKVTEIYSSSSFTVTDNKGEKLYGSIQMDPSNKKELMVTSVRDSSKLIRPLDKIVYIKEIDRKFWDRFKASLDLGWTWTKANNLHQFSFRTNLGYYGDKIALIGGTNIVRSFQDSGANVSRTDGYIDFKAYMPKDFFYLIRADFLQNTEQLLTLRTLISTGFGYNYVRTNRMIGSIALGATYNNENFENDTISKNTIEAFAGLNFDMFSVGDVTVRTSVIAYPSFSDLGRIRTDFNISAQYDLPLDFYIGAAFTLNYDNRPTQDASPTDFVLQTTFGWSW